MALRAGRLIAEADGDVDGTSGASMVYAMVAAADVYDEGVMTADEDGFWVLEVDVEGTVSAGDCGRRLYGTMSFSL